MTGAEHIELMKVDAEMRAALTNATKERGRRREWVDTERGPELAWVVYERHVMAVLTNRHRTSRGLGSVGVDRVLAVERRAAGHIDYVNKYAFGCAEMAVGWGS